MSVSYLASHVTLDNICTELLAAGIISLLAERLKQPNQGIPYAWVTMCAAIAERGKDRCLMSFPIGS